MGIPGTSLTTADNSLGYTMPDQPMPAASLNGAPQALSHGGRVAPRGMIAVHMAPGELDMLDHQQGHRKYAPDHNRMYPDLEGVYRNVHMKRMLVNHAKAHYAAGGHVDPRTPPHMRHIEADNGVHGDSEIAYIGPHMRHVFDEALGKPSRNVYDGHPQYFNLWNFLGGVGKGVFNAGKTAFNTVAPIVSPMIRSALPMLGTAASGAIGSTFGPMAGMMAGNLINSGGNALLDKFTPQGPQTEFQSNATDAGNQAMENYNNYTQSGQPVNNISDLIKSQGGFGGMAKTAANLGSSFLRSNPQMAPGEGANPLLKMGYNLASKYNSIAGQPSQQQQPQQQEQQAPQMGGQQMQQQYQQMQQPQQQYQQYQQPQQQYQQYPSPQQQLQQRQLPQFNVPQNMPQMGQPSLD